MTVHQVRRMLAQTFREAGIDSADLDARVILDHALGLDHAELATQAERTIGEDESERVRSLAARRLAREPVARIVGHKEFWSLPFLVTPAVLVPRPETETLVEAALDLVGRERNRDLWIADLGTGSGALLLALLSTFPRALGVGTDLSPAAIAVARDNAKRLGLASRASFAAGDFGHALKGSFDLIVTNPPYIAAQEWVELAPEVRDYDPKLALDGGDRGLAAYRRIAADACRLLARDAHMIVETGAGMAQDVAMIFADAGLAKAGCRPDLHGIPRALILRRAS